MTNTLPLNHGNRVTTVAILFLCCLIREAATSISVEWDAELGVSGDVHRFLRVDEPSLSGRHFKVTVVQQTGYVDIEEDNDGSLSFSGYLIDVLGELAKEDRGNFTYDLRTPSGFGIGCSPRLTWNNETAAAMELGKYEAVGAYGVEYRSQFICGESDVNDVDTDGGILTDFYWGTYFITPERLMKNKFTIPYTPPVRASITMMGAVTHVRDIHDLANNYASTYAVCAHDGAAYMASIATAFPQLNIKGISFAEEGVHQALTDGTCDIIFASYPDATLFVRSFSLNEKCLVNGLPIGVIGEPLEFGLNHFAFGVRNDLPDEVLQTFNYWLQALMACFPNDPNGHCPADKGGGSLSQLYIGRGGTGKECGYVQFPPMPNSDDGLSNGVIVAIAVTPLIVALALAMLYHMQRLKAQEHRMKKRFIQQLARNIEIGGSAHDIPAEKLLEQFQHIGGEDGYISKQDLATWINDLNMEFISEKDFDRLWDTMDMEGQGIVAVVDFTIFLTECGKQFKEVQRENQELPKTERLKLAARRLTNFEELGEEGVKQMERRNNRRSRMAVNTGSSDLGTTNYKKSTSDGSAGTTASNFLKKGSSYFNL